MDNEYWEQELAKLEALEANTDAAWDSFWNQLKEIDRMFNGALIRQPGRKRKFLTSCPMSLSFTRMVELN